MKDAPKTIVTKREIIQALERCGVRTGDTLLLHSSLSALGYVVGGAHTVLDALLCHLGEEGTLVVPTHTADNTNPANWQFPPVPESWWQTIRDEAPAFDPARTPTRQMGAIAELFRTWPGVIRSNHPVGSFAAFGPLASALTHDVPLQPEFGEGSTLSRLYEHGAKIALLGVAHDRNTSLHLAEYRADFKKQTVREGCAMLVDGKREWVEFDMMALETDDFVELGAAFESGQAIGKTELGDATLRVIEQRALVDFATDWMTMHRP